MQWHICPRVLTHHDKVRLKKQMRRNRDVCQITERHRPLSGSVMVSNVSFSSVVSGEQAPGLGEHRWINEDAGGIKAEIFQLPSGDATAENQKTICSPACSSLWDNCSSKERCCTGCKTDLWHNYTNKRQAHTLSWTHTHTRFQKVPSVGCKMEKKKEIFKRVHGNGAVETNLQLFSTFPRKSNPSENSLNWFGVAYSHQEGRAFICETTKKKAKCLSHSGCDETFEAALIEGDKQRQLGRTLKSATYCMHVLPLALELLSVALIRCVWWLFCGPWRGLKDWREGKRKDRRGIYCLFVFIYLFIC